jgi:cytochrome c-type protein NapB
MMNRPISLTLAVVLAAAIGSGCAHQGSGPQSLRGSEAVAPDPTFQEKQYVGGEPGKQKNLARSFRDAPPLIPHAMPNYDDISLQTNKCLECHSPDTYRKKDSPRVGDSHMTFIDTKDGMQRVVNMNRYQCTSCHVAQADAKPLVDSVYVSDIPPR